MTHTDSSFDSPVALPLLWGIVAGIIGVAAAPLDPNLLEEGIVLHTAQRMLAGEHLYRDVVSHTGPLPYEFLALLFQLFGAKVLAARSAVVGLQIAGTVAVYASARRSGVGDYAHAAAAAVAAAPLLGIPLFSIFYYSTIAFYLGLIAVYAGLRALRSDGWAIATGVLVAGVALCKQNTGVQLAAFLLPAIAIGVESGCRIRRTSRVALGGALVAGFTLALYAIRGDLPEFVFAQVQLPFAMASAASFQTPYMNFWPPGELSPVVRDSWAMYLPSLYHMRFGLFVEIGRGIVVVTQLLYALPWLALAATVVCALRARVDPVIWLHGAFLAAMTAGLYPRSDWGHLVVALPPALVQLFLLAGGRARHAGRRRSRVLARAAAAGLIAAAAGAGVWLHGIAGPAVFGPEIPLRPVTRATQGSAIPRVIHYLRRHVRPNEAIFVARQEPLIYFATGTRNPTPFEGVLPGLREWQEPLILAALADVRYVVMSDIDQPIYTFYSDELPAVWKHFERHYRIATRFPVDDYSWIQVLERGPDRGPTLADLTELPSRRWVREADGSLREHTDPPQRLASRQLRRPLPLPLGPGGGAVDFDLEIPDGAVFQAGVGFRGLVSIDHQYIHPPGITLVVSVRDEADFEPIASVRINDGLRAGRRWQPFEADLGAYAGRRVTLRLEARAERPLPPGNLSWLGSPRITRAAPATETTGNDP